MKFMSGGSITGLILSLFAMGSAAEWLEPDISDASVDVEVSFNQETGIFSYEYTVTNPSSSFAPVKYFWIKTGPGFPTSLLGERSYLNDVELVSDGSLKSNYSSIYAIPMGVESPPSYESSIGRGGDVVWVPAGVWGQLRDLIDPGESLTGFSLHSRVPPGLLSATLEPDIDMGPGSPYEEYGELCGEDDSPCPDPKTFWEVRRVVGPQLPEERELMDGKGQRGRDVGKFLRFANPLEASVDLPPGTDSFNLVVVFGDTIKPASFAATLNRRDISEQFTVAPSGTAVVKLPLQPGRNKVVLSVEGLRDDGRLATDTDQLSFVVK